MTAVQAIRDEGFLTPGTHRIPIQYTTMPVLQKLQADFSDASDLEVFAPRGWGRHPKALIMDEDVVMRSMVVAHFDITRLKSLTVPDAMFVDLAKERRLHPATHIDLYALTQVLPPPERGRLIAPGSFRTCPGGRHYASYRGGSSGGRVLETIFTPGNLGINHLFLFVQSA